MKYKRHLHIDPTDPLYGLKTAIRAEKKRKGRVMGGWGWYTLVCKANSNIRLRCKVSHETLSFLKDLGYINVA